MKRFFITIIMLMVCSFFATPVNAQDIDPKDVNVTLDQALSRAQETAVKEFSDLDDYYIVTIVVYTGINLFDTIPKRGWYRNEKENTNPS